MPKSLAPIAGDGYAMNAADLAGGGFSSGGLGNNNLGLGSIANSQAPKMIPVPGLPTSQQGLQQQQQQQQQSNMQQQMQQRNNLQHQQSNVVMPRTQQSQQPLPQISKSQGVYHAQVQQPAGLVGQKQPGVLLQHPLNIYYLFSLYLFLFIKYINKPKFLIHVVMVIIASSVKEIKDLLFGRRICLVPCQADHSRS